MVCMAANGAMSVNGGNWQIFEHMLNASSATVHLSTPIVSISRKPSDTFNPTNASPCAYEYILTTASNTTTHHDTLILAAPYQSANLAFTNFTPRHIPQEIPYVKLHVTLIATPLELSPAAFGLSDNAKVPTFVLTTLPEGEDPGHNSKPGRQQGSPGFFSISVVATSLNPNSTPPNRPEYVYKIFSAEPVTSEFLTRILSLRNRIDIPDVTNEKGEGDDGKGIDTMFDPDGEVTWLHQKVWHSYPYEYPRVTFEEMVLDEGFWYTSGIESFISTMETSALMGRNVARLVVDGWVNGVEDVLGESGMEVGDERQEVRAGEGESDQERFVVEL